MGPTESPVVPHSLPNEENGLLSLKHDFEKMQFHKSLS